MPVQAASIVLFGSLSPFTCFTLQSLLQEDFNVRGLVLAAYPPPAHHSSDTPNEIYLSSKHELVELAAQHNIPLCYFVADIEQLETFLQTQSADLFLLACYPRRLPMAIGNLANCRCINIHPSKLPNYRGPDPVFWQLKLDETDTGVTLHEVSQIIDGGAILHFDMIAYPQGARLEEIQSLLIQAATSGLSSLLNLPSDKWSSTPQSMSPSSWYGAPCELDFTINNVDMTARAAFNFVRAYSGSSNPITVIDGNRNLRVRDATRYRGTGTIPASSGHSDRVPVRFSDGIVEFIVEHQSQFK